MSTWISERMDIICPHCGAYFQDEIYYMPTPDWHYPRYCPDCGEKVYAEGERQISEQSKKCHGCSTLLSLSKTCFFVKAKGQPMRFYCEKCAKERGFHGSTGKRN